MESEQYKNQFQHEAYLMFKQYQNIAIFIRALFNSFFLAQISRDNYLSIMIVIFQIMNLHLYFDTIEIKQTLKIENIITLFVVCLSSMLTQAYYLVTFKKMYDYEIKQIVIKKIQGQRYKRICDTVQEGILILQGSKIKFINEIFQNLQFINKIQQVPSRDNSPTKNFINKRIFYIYSLGDDLEKDNAPQYDKYGLSHSQIEGTEPLYL